MIMFKYNQVLKGAQKVHKNKKILFFVKIKKLANDVVASFLMAGAVRFELTTRGLGDIRRVFYDVLYDVESSLSKPPQNPVVSRAFTSFIFQNHSRPCFSQIALTPHVL